MPRSKMSIAPRARGQRVPLGDQAGLAALGAVAVLFIGLGVLAVRHLPKGIGRELGALVLVVAIVAGAFLLLQAAPRALMWTLEDVFNRDVDDDGNIGEPSSEIRFLPLRSNSVSSNDDTWQAFVRGCATDTSERRWIPVLGEQTYSEWRDMLVAQGYAEWRNADHRQGWQLTATPDEILRAVEPEGGA